jgi:hypothetical protein
MIDSLSWRKWGYPPIPTHTETQQDLLEIVSTVFAMPIGRARGSGGLRFVYIRPIERNGRRILMEPRGRDRIDLQRFEGDHAKNLVEIRGKQGIEDMAETVIVERGTWQRRLQQRYYAALFQPFTYLIEGMMSIQNGKDQGFDPTSAREPMRRMRRDKAVNHTSHLQTP